MPIVQAPSSSAPSPSAATEQAADSDPFSGMSLTADTSAELRAAQQATGSRLAATARDLYAVLQRRGGAAQFLSNLAQIENQDWAALDLAFRGLPENRNGSSLSEYARSHLSGVEEDTAIDRIEGLNAERIAGVIWEGCASGNLERGFRYLNLPEAWGNSEFQQQIEERFRSLPQNTEQLSVDQAISSAAERNQQIKMEAAATTAASPDSAPPQIRHFYVPLPARGDDKSAKQAGQHIGDPDNTVWHLDFERYNQAREAYFRSQRPVDGNTAEAEAPVEKEPGPVSEEETAPKQSTIRTTWGGIKARYR